MSKQRENQPAFVFHITLAGKLEQNTGDVICTVTKVSLNPALEHMDKYNITFDVQLSRLV